MIDLSFNRVSKRYAIHHEDVDGAPRNRVLRKMKNLFRRPEIFWAVRDVSFEVKRGETLGIIGHNGAGKSTILKLLSNITTPSSGEIVINGRLSALIEVGSGFHPELTGRENIYLSGSILGMRRREIAAKLDSIVEFAGVSQFIDTPVKRYSSGMYVRLGFAIAAHLDPDILLLDEVLAVGDAAFQNKCFQRIEELRSKGTTIVFISHDMGAVERLCKRSILMHKGEVLYSGTTSEVINKYIPVANINHAYPTDGLIFNNSSDNDYDMRVKLKRIEVLDKEGQVKRELRTGEYAKFRIHWDSKEYIEDGGLEFYIQTLEEAILIRYSTRPLSNVDVKFYPGSNSIEIEFPSFPLAAGDYYLGADLIRPAIEWLHGNMKFAVLTVRENDIFNSGTPLRSDISFLATPHRWIKDKETK
jgi:lipopolysaccharide transport system ATP-binding protein